MLLRLQEQLKTMVSRLQEKLFPKVARTASTILMQSPAACSRSSLKGVLGFLMYPSIPGSTEGMNSQSSR